VPTRPLDDAYIRELCAKVVDAKDAELDDAINQLNQALHEHSLQLRKLAVEKLSAPPSNSSES